jgi:hypothetical protein
LLSYRTLNVADAIAQRISSDSFEEAEGLAQTLDDGGVGDHPAMAALSQSAWLVGMTTDRRNDDCHAAGRPMACGPTLKCRVRCYANGFGWPTTPWNRCGGRSIEV